MNYDLMIANCRCNSNMMEYIDNNNKTDNKEGKEKVDFNSIAKSLITSLLDFNINVIYCYNLVFNLKILKINIGFFCMFIMFILQFICFIIYLSQKLNSIKYFMLIFNNNISKDYPLYSINKYYNNLLTQNKLDENKTKKAAKNPDINFLTIKLEKKKVNIKNISKENNKSVVIEDEANKENESKSKLNIKDNNKALSNIFEKKN